MRKNRVQRELLTRLMAGPNHGDLLTRHRMLEQLDPSFYAEVAAWYARRGKDTAQREAFVATLLASTDPSRRALGVALAERLGDEGMGRVVCALRRSGQFGPMLRRSLRRTPHQSRRA